MGAWAIAEVCHLDRLKALVSDSKESTIGGGGGGGV